MLVVLVILGVVLAALTQLFVSATRTEVDQNKRFQAQQEARLALDGLRREIHCASAVVGDGRRPPPGRSDNRPESSVRITLGSYCPTTSGPATPATSRWCTQRSGAAGRYALWRVTPSVGRRTSRARRRSRKADYLTTPASVPSRDALRRRASRRRRGEAQASTFPVDVDPTRRAGRARYELTGRHRPAEHPDERERRRSPSSPSLPGLAFGSFLNVVTRGCPTAARSCTRRRRARRATRRSRGTTTSRCSPTLLLRGRCRSCGTRIGWQYPAVELLTALLVAACFLAFGLTFEAAIAAFFCTALVAVSVIDIERFVIPNRIVLPAAAARARGADDPRAVARVGDRGLRRGALPPARGARVSRRDGDGRRQARAPARLHARPHRSDRADDRVSSRRSCRRPCCSPATAAPPGRCGSRSARSSPSAASSPSSGATGSSTPTWGCSDGARRPCPCPLTSSPGFARFRRRQTAPIDEGFASSLDTARQLAEQFHLPLVDLAAEGIDLAATRLIPLPVLERVCAIPFAFDGERLRIAVTEPQNVHGLDELRLATRHSTEFSVAVREDVLTELRRLARASEALNAVLMDDAVAAGAPGRRGGRPRGRRRHLGRAARAARQLDHLPGGRGRRERHPLRAAGRRARRALPDRRRAARRRADPAHGSPPA